MVRLSFALAFAVILAGCGGGGTPAPTVPPTQQLLQSSALDAGTASPETCDTSVRLLFHKGDSAFRLPKCAGWKGLIRYPSTGKISRWVITTSVTNNFGAPPPPSGRAILYMQMYVHSPRGGVSFQNHALNDTVTSPTLTSTHTYTLNVYNFFYNDQCPSSQCTWTLNIGSPQPGSHSITFSSPLNGASVLSGNPDGPVWQFVED
jgi:hypothetical protein